MLDDVKVKSNSIMGIIGGGRTAAYGWKKMTKLAKTLPYVDSPNDANACDHNADTIAYFALGIYLQICSYLEAC